MRTILLIAGAMVVAGTVMAQMADRMTHAKPKTTVGVAAATQNGKRSVVIPSDRRGHFRTDATIGNERIAFMVDTGASVVALNESSAARFGYKPSPKDYTAVAKTANGQVRAARTRLSFVDIGGLVVHDVEAMVLPDRALSENLLGLSYLSRLRRYEYANGQMVLEQ